MKLRFFIVLAFVASAAFAQEQQTEEKPVENPDFSKPTLMRVLAYDEAPDRLRRFHHTPGAIEFRALGMDWRLAYLPILMPLSGSRMGVTNQWPDPFALAGTQIAPPPTRTWRERRAYNAELRRINRSDRKRGKVVVKN